MKLSIFAQTWGTTYLFIANLVSFEHNDIKLLTILETINFNLFIVQRQVSRNRKNIILIRYQNVDSQLQKLYICKHQLMPEKKTDHNQATRQAKNMKIFRTAEYWTKDSPQAAITSRLALSSAAEKWLVRAEEKPKKKKRGALAFQHIVSLTDNRRQTAVGPKTHWPAFQESII